MLADTQLCHPPMKMFSRRPGFARAAFTLVEMLTVMSVIVILLGLVAPAVIGIGGSGDFTMAAGGIANTLEQARSYAMANNTYVYVGINEFDVSESTSVSPRGTGPGKVGQIVVAVVAARDGTRGYDALNQAATSWTSYYQKGAPLLAIDKLHLYSNVHLADLESGGNAPPTTGKMARPGVDPTGRVGNANCVSLTPLSWPLGSDLGKGQYNFTNVIQFDPQGVARIQITNSDSISSFVEIGLQPTHGNAAPASPADQNFGNQAALLIDCMTGAVRLYRP